jgi:6-pyruvoyltetrahydropterin/6-carboxytetrahydropterin synthase
MYEIGITAQFEAAHRLVGDFGPATRTHGHTYRLDVVVRGERLGAGEVLYDIGKLQPAIQDLAGSLHYRDLDELPALAGRNTTAEAVAGYCWDQLAALLHGQGLASLLVRIWESPQVYAGRDEPLRP